MPLTSTASTSISDTVWISWTYSGTSSGNYIVWAGWNSGLTSITSSYTVAGSNVVPGWQAPTVPMCARETPETEEQRIVREERNRQAAIAATEARRKAWAEHEAAREKAEVLLRDHLTAEQLASLIKVDSFEMLSSSGKCYRVRRGFAGNVYLVENEREVMKFCIHPDESVPDADAMLAQKLLLETDEAMFLRIANRTVLAVNP